MKLNEKGYRHARSLIKAGKVDESSSWSFSAEDGNRLLGDPPNWDNYGKWFLGVRPDTDPETKKHWAYPFGKNGKVYRSALRAIRTRAAQQNHADIFEAAGRLLSELDKGREKNRAGSVEVCRIESGDEILVLPLGEIKGRDGRYWVLSQEDAETIIAQIKRDGVDIVVDYDHASYFRDDTRAAGWLKADSFRVGDGAFGPGIYARVEWTEAAEQAISAKEYRYLSPTFYADGTRILALESVALTNIPNLPMLPALNRRGGNPAKEEPMEKELNRLREENARLSADLVAVRKEKEELERELNKTRESLKAKEAEAQKFAEELEKLKEAEREREINALVEQAISEGKLAPAQKEAAVELGRRDLEMLKKWIESAPAAFKGLTKETEPGELSPQKFDYPGKVDEERLALHQRVLALSREKNISYREALNLLKEETHA